MPDRLYLSLWTKSNSALGLPSRFGTLLRAFPFSRLAPGFLLTVRGISSRETPLLEQSFETGQIDDLVAACETWQNPDSAFEVESAWDLLQPNGAEWHLAPARVLLTAFGPEYERDRDEQFQIEFGRETSFIPQADAPQSFKMIEGNIRSLLKLVGDLEKALPLSRRLLWSESGENFAGKLAQLVAE